MIRVYGPTRGNSSWPRVTAGLCTGLSMHQSLAGFVPTDDIGHELDDAIPAGFDAPIGIHVGPPTVASVMRGRGQHEWRLAMIAVNSTFAPTLAMKALEQHGAITGYVTPSLWASGVLVRHTELPVYTWPHGVSTLFAEVNEAPPRDHWRVLHMASTHADRKGTAQLIAAWGELMSDGAIPANSRLRLVCDGPRGFFDDAIGRARQSAFADVAAGGGIVSAGLAGDPIGASYEVTPRLDLSETDTCKLYQAHDLVIQPSRGEGFGMVPLEARVAGVPVAMTRCTGHEEHAETGPRSYRLVPRGPLGRDGLPAVIPLHLVRIKGVVMIESGPCAPIDDGPDATAPSVSVGQVKVAIRRAYVLRSVLAVEAAEAAPAVLEQHRWGRTAENFLNRYWNEP